MADSGLPEHINALLFAEGGAMARKRLASHLGCSEAEVGGALRTLGERLEGSGVSLIVTPTEAALVVSAQTAETVQKAFERELGKEIGDAGLEVLAIVLYRGPSTRAQIDYIRGVNTASTLRSLLARGLLERVGNPNDAREYLYRPTVELLAHLGVNDISRLPEYMAINAELAAFEAEAVREREEGHE